MPLAMPLAAGSRLGPYEIRAPIGAGGMGEVYRARDPRLGRDVALKIVASGSEHDPEYLRRFELEARAVGALNNPHILAIHDVGTENGLAYVVLELLEGQTLRDRIAHGPIPPRKAVEYGIQICRGLAAAHSRGIIHRDLKPENLFLTSDGLIKVLDFGLAKLSAPSDIPTEEAVTRTATDPGVVMGTAGYMSPEQARGKRADARSDVFALGAILYEMLAGRPAFAGETAVDRLSAILHHDPPELTSSNRESVPPGLERIVRRCLEKDPEDRFQAARDVAFALDAVGGSTSREVFATPRSRRRRVLNGVIAALLLAATAAGGFFIGRSRLERPVPVTRQLTFGRGTVTGARFTQDERTVVYSASWEGKGNQIYVTRLDAPEVRSLELPPAKLLSVSSHGELAILLTKPDDIGDPTIGTLARVPLAGGVARPMLEDVQDADWSPDGQDLAVVRTVNGEWQLEYPLGTVLWRPVPCCTFTHSMRVSPRGDRVAVIGPNGQLTIVGKTGERRSVDLTDGSSVGLAWVTSGDAVWVSGGAGLDRWSIREFTLEGSRRDVFHAPGVHVIHDLARSGAALVHHGFEHWGIRVKPRHEPERELSGVRVWNAQDVSADGTSVVVGEPSNDNVYLYSLRGGEPLLLSRGSPFWRAGAQLSPDGKWLLGGPVGQQDMAELIPTGAGESRKLPIGKWQGVQGSWLDADHIYWNASEPGAAQARGFVQDIQSGAVHPVTPEGVEGVFRSPVVKGAVLGLRSDGALAWYPIAGGEPRPTAARLPANSTHVRTTPDGRWTFVSRLGIPTRIDRIDLLTGHQEPWKSLAPPDLAGVAYMNPFVPMTADGEVYVYNYLRTFQDLYLVEGLR
jgi:hypothetical protein